MKSSYLGIRLGKDVKTALVKAATEDDRDISAMARKIIMSWLRDNEYLPTTRGN